MLKKKVIYMFKNKVKCASCYKTYFDSSDKKAKVGDLAEHSCDYCFKDTVLVIKPGLKKLVRPPYVIKDPS